MRGLSPRFAFPVFCVCLIAGGCRQNPSAADSVKGIRAAEAGMFQAIQSRDVDKTVSFYAQDASALYDGFPPIHDLNALRADYQEFLGDRNFSFQAQSTRTDASGDLGYTEGSVRYSYTDPTTNKAAHFSGSYVMVWKRQADGSWKAVEDISTAGPPPAAQ
jgi:ketosteroid isomerase-like protein